MQLFRGFELQTVHVDAGAIRLRVGGNGPPVLLLHGHPRTHMTWGSVAGLLAPSFTVICPDLPGFGQPIYRQTRLTAATRRKRRRLQPWWNS